MVTRPVSTKHSRWQATKDVKPGQYLKHHGRWHLAVSDAITTHESFWVQVLNTVGQDHWLRLYVADVEVYAEGKRPKPFTPAELRRRAREDRAEAEELQVLAGDREAFARRLESGAVRG